eukprot:9015-Pyramimonas_sp.AAC.1
MDKHVVPIHGGVQERSLERRQPKWPAPARVKPSRTFDKFMDKTHAFSSSPRDTLLRDAGSSKAH